jgi:hypothetical protein
VQRAGTHTRAELWPVLTGLSRTGEENELSYEITTRKDSAGHREGSEVGVALLHCPKSGASVWVVLLLY